MGDWQPGRYAWKLEQLHLLTPPIPVKGKQGLWDFPLPLAELNRCIQSISPTNKLTESFNPATVPTSISPTNELTEQTNPVTTPIPISPTNELTEQTDSATTPKPISPTNKSSPQTAFVAHSSPFFSRPSASAFSISPTNTDNLKVPLCKAFQAHSLTEVSPASSNGGVHPTFTAAASSSNLFVGEIETLTLNPNPNIFVGEIGTPTPNSNPTVFVGEIESQTRFPWTPPASEAFLGEIGTPASSSSLTVFVGEIDNQTRFPWTPLALETFIGEIGTPISNSNPTVFVGEIDFTVIPNRHPYPQLSTNGQSVAHPTTSASAASKNFGTEIHWHERGCVSQASTSISKLFVGEIAFPPPFPNPNAEINSVVPRFIPISKTNTSSLLAVSLHPNPAISPTNTSHQMTWDCCCHSAISKTNVLPPQLSISPTNAAIEEQPECPFTIGMYVALTADDGDRQAGSKGQVTAIRDCELIVTWEDTREPQQTVYELTSVALPLRRLGRKPGSHNRKPASGTLRQRTEKRRLASGQVAEFPRVGGKRDRNKPHHWFWSYEYSHKSPNGKWRTIKRGVPRSRIAAVRDAIALHQPIADILKLLESKG